MSFCCIYACKRNTYIFLVTIGTDINGTSGQMISPSYPSNYPTDTRLQCTITVPVGLRIRIDFVDLHIEPGYTRTCDYDYLKVRFGIPFQHACTHAQWAMGTG